MDLSDLTRELETLRDEALAAIAAAPDVAALEAIELDVLGKKGRLTGVLRGIGALPGRGPAARRRGRQRRPRRDRSRPRGAGDGAARLGARGAARRRGGRCHDARPARSPAARSTRASRPCARSREIFGQFGFVTYESPEIEDDLTNFQMLNIPPDHPARDLWDTLYVDVEGHLLRTHTSPGQIRVMQTTTPPIRALLPGRCYRYEAIDASHAHGVLPGRRPDGRRGDDDGATSRASSTSSPRRCTAPTSGRGSGPATTRSPSRPSRSTWSASSAAARAARPAGARAG